MFKAMSILCLSVFFSQPSSAQEGFEVIPQQLAPKYHFNLSRHFYVDDSSFQKDMSEAKKLVEEAQAYKGKVAAAGPALYELAQKMERLNLLTQKLFVYRYLAYAVDTKQQPAMSETERIVSELSGKVAFVSTELRQLSEADLNKLIAEEPRLEQYRFFLLQNTRYKAHTLTAQEEQLMAQLSPQLFSWQSQFFQKLIDRTKFAKIKTDSGELDVYRDRSVLSKNKDRNIRKEALLKLYEQYAGNADLMGFLLVKEADALNTTAEMRKYNDAFDSSLFDAYMSNKEAESFFAEIGKFAPTMQRYIQLRKGRIKAISGIDPVEPWDAEVVPENYKRPVFTIKESTDILLKSLAFHGDPYSKDLANLLDPENGRLDIVKGENRIPGAFAWGYYGAPFVFYSFTYHGYVDDLLTLSHEAGHVVHYDLIWQNKVPPAYADGPAYFTESFAMLNEFITTDYLINNAKSKDDKIFFLEQWLSVALRRFFDIVMRSEFEYTAYQKLKSGEVTEAEQIHELWKSEGLKYVGDDYKRHDFLKYNWSFTPHFFSSPRYYFNYLVANLMALSYYQRHYNDPEFDRKYVTLMTGGFPDTPLKLLKKHLNLNPFDPQNVKEAMSVFDEKLALLEKLYKE